MKTLYFSLAVIGLSFLTVFSSCNKDEKKQTDPQYVINGVELYDAQATAMGNIGSPDNLKEVDEARLTVFPIPCRSHLQAIVQITNAQPAAIKTTLVHVIYPSAPASYNYAGGDELIKVENQDLAGEIARSDIRNVEAAPNGQTVNLSLDMEGLPRGFYKLTVEISNGRKMYMAVFIQ